MIPTRRAVLLLVLAPLVLAQAPAETTRTAADPCAPRPQLYVAAMGEPFRGPAGAPDPAGQWFAQADANRDGRVTAAEFVADADRFFIRLDRNGDGEIDPPEVIAYESGVAPEIRLYQRAAPGGEGKARANRKSAARAAFDGALGAGRYAQLNIPEPVASADQDFDRGITRAEFRSTAARRFALLGPDATGALTLAGLGRTPAQGLLAECASRPAKPAGKG